MKNFKRVLSLALAALMVIGGLVVAPVDAKAEDTYTKVTSVDQITDEGYYLMAVEQAGKHYAMKIDLGGTFVNCLEVSIDGNNITAPGFVPVWKISKTSNGTYTLHNGKGYLSYIEAKKVELSETASAQKQEWTIAATEGGFSIQNATDSATALCYNIDSPRFAPYKTGNTKMNYNIVLYKYNGATVTYPQNIEALPSTATQEEIVAAAYKAMYDGVSFAGTYTITGVIAKDVSVNNNKVSVDIIVGDKAVQCYQLVYGDVTDFKKGDSITVEGTIGYYTSTVQMSGATLKAYTPAPADDNNNNTENTTPTVTPESPVADIIAAVKALEAGASLEGTFTLEGKVEVVGTSYNAAYGNATITIKIGEDTIECYRLSGTDVNSVVKGDTIKVSGTLANNNGAIRLNSGKLVSRTGELAAVPALPADATPAQILAAANALGKFQSLAENVTLSGVITAIDTEYSEQYKNISVTIQVGDKKEDTILCYRLGAKDKNNADEVAKVAALKVGDTVTVKGTIINYNGTVEFSTPALQAVVPATVPSTGDFATAPILAVLFFGVALVAVSVIGKRKMA